MRKRDVHTLSIDNNIQGKVANSCIFQSHLLCKPLTQLSRAHIFINGKCLVAFIIEIHTHELRVRVVAEGGRWGGHGGTK